MRIGAIVHARMSSSRLPGKVLMPIRGRVALGMLLDRLAIAQELDIVAVATSDLGDDDAIAEFCQGQRVPCHRGPLDDVARRVLDAAEVLELDAFVRVNGDSPLLDPSLVDQAVRLLRDQDVDLVTNVFPRSFPVGQSVEAVRIDAMRKAVRELSDPMQREHVTQWFYENPDMVRIRNIHSEQGDWSSMVLALDRPEDVRALSSVVARMDARHELYGWREIVDLRRSL